MNETYTFINYPVCLFSPLSIYNFVLSPIMFIYAIIKQVNLLFKKIIKITASTIDVKTVTKKETGREIKGNFEFNLI